MKNGKLENSDDARSSLESSRVNSSIENNQTPRTSPSPTRRSRNPFSSPTLSASDLQDSPNNSRERSPTENDIGLAEFAFTMELNGEKFIPSGKEGR